MATYYMRQRDPFTEWNDAASWSLSSAGPANGQIPTQNDDVIIDDDGPAQFIAIRVNGLGAVCRNLTFTGNVNGNWGGFATVTIYGDFDSSAHTTDHSSSFFMGGGSLPGGDFTFASSSAQTINWTNFLTGFSGYGVNMTFNGTGSWLLTTGGASIQWSFVTQLMGTIILDRLKSHSWGSYLGVGSDTNLLQLKSNSAGNAASLSIGSITPIANFSASPTTGRWPLEVDFTNTSLLNPSYLEVTDINYGGQLVVYPGGVDGTGNTNVSFVPLPTSWSWDFGDGDTSTDENPSHTYIEGDTFFPELTVNNGNRTASHSVTVDTFPRTMFNAGTNGILKIAPPQGTTANPILDGSNIGGKRRYILPDKSGTIALLSDLVGVSASASRSPSASASPSSSPSISTSASRSPSASASPSSGGGGTPGGADQQIQFNNMGSFDGDDGFIWDYTNHRLGVGQPTPTQMIDVSGNLLVESVDQPTNPTITNQGAAGSTQYDYEIVPISRDGHAGVANSKETTTGNATLNGSNFNRITWNDSPEAASYDIYRFFSGGTPSSLGKIGTVLQGVQTFDDTGLAGDSATTPTNDTGSIYADISLFFNFVAGVNHYIKIRNNESINDYPGANLIIEGSMGKGTGTGGSIDIYAGWDEANNGFGAELFLQPSPATGKPGYSYLEGAYAADGDGGDLVLFGGGKEGSGTLDGQVAIGDINTGFWAILSTLSISANRTFTFPDQDGVFATVTSGSGAPGSTPAAVGQIYVDTTGLKVYASTGTSSSGDWKILN